MSQPVLSGEQLQIEVTDGVLRITNDPGFTSDNGDGCPYRAVWLRRADGVTLLGKEWPSRTTPDVAQLGGGVNGVFRTRDEFAAWRYRPPALDGWYWLRVYGGTYFKGWGDTPEDYIEWGYTDQGKNPSGVVRANEVTFTVPAVQTPPPEETLPFDVARLKEILFNTLAEEQKAKASYASWRRANLGEAIMVDDYLEDLVDGYSPTPPVLTTHRGRGIVGLLEAAAEVMGRLP